VPGVLKSGIPADVEMPAPTTITIFFTLPFFKSASTSSISKSSEFEFDEEEEEELAASLLSSNDIFCTQSLNSVSDIVTLSTRGETANPLENTVLVLYNRDPNCFLKRRFIS